MLVTGQPAFEQLRRGGMAQAVRVHLHPHPLPGVFDAGARQVFLERFVAVQEDVVGRTDPAHRQVCLERLHGGVGHVDGAVFHALTVAHREPASPQVQVFQAQLFQLAQP